MARQNYCLQGQLVQCPMVGEFGKAKFYLNGKKEKEAELRVHLSSKGTPPISCELPLGPTSSRSHVSLLLHAGKHTLTWGP